MTAPLDADPAAVLLAYARAVDAGDEAALAGLLATDVRYETSATVVSGVQAVLEVVRAAAASRDGVRHLLTDVRADPPVDGVAVARSTFLFVAHAEGWARVGTGTYRARVQLAAGVIDDLVVTVDGTWALASTGPTP